MKKTATRTNRTPDPRRVAAGRKAAATKKARALARAKEDAIASAPNWGWKVIVDEKGRVILAK